jgi:hypothetical protein
VSNQVRNSYQLSAISYQLSAISYQLSAISYQLSAPKPSISHNRESSAFIEDTTFDFPCDELRADA